MNIIQRWELAYNTPLANILFLLFSVLLLLIITYYTLRYFQRKNDLLRYIYQSYYQKAESIAAQFHFLKKPKAGFFGRQSIVKTEAGYGLCVIPPPDLAFAQVKANFNGFHQLSYLFSFSCFSTYSWVHTEKSFITIQNDLFQSNGYPLLTIPYFLKDKKLSQSDKESVLLSIAKDLSTLHQLKTENGEKLYHGFLIPQMIFLDVDPLQRIQRIIIAHLGLVFSMQSRLLYCRLESLKKGNIPIEKYEAEQILEQIPMLSPEQKDFDRLHEVGPCSDFYSYGALAVYIFTGKRFISSSEIEWHLVPMQWHSFLKSCLSNEVSKRPVCFLELEDWLGNTELVSNLSYVSKTDSQSLQTEETFSENEFPIDYLEHVLPKLRQYISKNSEKVHEEKNRELIYPAIRAMKLSKWEEAKQHLEKVLVINPENALAHFHFSLLLFEMGDMKNSEKEYYLATKNNPSLARDFREHISALG